MEINATIIVSALSFIIFIFIMNNLLYEPILKIMQERNDYINNNKDTALAHKNKANALIDDKNQKISEHHKKSRDLVAAKVEALKAEKANVLNSKKSELGSYYSEQKQHLSDEKEQILNQAKLNTADIANNITTALIGAGIAFEPLSEAEVEEVMKKNA